MRNRLDWSSSGRWPSASVTSDAADLFASLSGWSNSATQLFIGSRLFRLAFDYFLFQLPPCKQASSCELSVSASDSSAIHEKGRGGAEVCRNQG